MYRIRKLELALVLFFVFISMILFLGWLNLSGLSFYNTSENAPSDFIREDQISVYSDKIVIEIENYTLSKYSFSKSMVPFFDSGANGIGIKPDSPENIHVGDIITFREGDDLIVHRIVEKGIDENGWFFITKGDNNRINDGKIRFQEIDSILVGIVY